MSQNLEPPSSSVQAAHADHDRIAYEIARGSGRDPFVSAVRATRMPMVITDPRQPDNPVVFANESFCRMTGYTRDEIIGRNCRFLQGPQTDHAVVGRIRTAVKNAQPIETDIRNHRKDGTAFWNRLLMAPVFDATGELAYFFASQVDVSLELERLAGLESRNVALLVELSDRLRSQAESEARLRLATQAGRLGIWELDLRTGDLAASAICRENFGHGPDTPLGLDELLRALNPDDRAQVRDAIAHAASAGADFDIECHVHHDDGQIGTVQLRAQVLRDPAGKPMRIAGVSLDLTERRAAESRLELSEASLRLATEAAEIGTWDLDTLTDRLTWSDRTKAMFGISPGIVCSMEDFTAGLHPDDRDVTLEAFGRAIDPAIRASYDVEYRTIGREDKAVRWVAAKGRGIFDMQGRCVRALGTAIDITARRGEDDRQSFLLRLLDRLRLLNDPVEIMQAAVSSLGQFLRASRAGFGQLRDNGASVRLEAGYAEAPEQMTGTHPATVFGPAMEMLGRGEVLQIGDVAQLGDVPPGFWELIDTSAFIAAPLLRGDRLSGFLYVAHQRPRAWQPWEVALVDDVAARIWDAVARARAEAALRTANVSLEQQVLERTGALQASQARMRAIFETTYQLQGFLDVDGTVLDANTTSLAVIGRTLPQMLGRKFWDCEWFADTPGLSELVREFVGRAASGEETRGEVVANLPGGKRAYDLSLRPIRGEAGQVIAILPEAMDLTERRRVEEQLRQAQKMEAVGQLTGGIAHDFNNLLTGIVGSLELMSRRLASGRTDGLARYAEAATASAMRAASLTQRLLAFARRQPLDPKRVDANALMTGMEDLLARTLGPAILLEMSLSGDLWPILTDPHQLENAILNLAINARDAMPRGGRLLIGTSNEQVPATHPGVLSGDIAEGDYVMLSVEDAGLGMSPEVLARAFEPFFTTKPLGQGTGLGLSMLYGFIRQSAGHVRVQSEAGVGTVFELYLPRESQVSQEDLDGAGTQDGTRLAGAGETVLVVEDEATVRMLVLETLAELGYATLDAQDGPSGLKILQSGARVDLLVTDVGLPGLNGRQLADAARASRPNLPVLFMTGYAHNAELAQGDALEPGMELIAKPFTLDALIARIKTMLPT